MDVVIEKETDGFEALFRRLYSEGFKGWNAKELDERILLTGFRPLKAFGFLWQKKGACRICDEPAKLFAAWGQRLHEGKPVGKEHRIGIPTSPHSGVSETAWGVLILETPQYLRCPEGHVGVRMLGFRGGDDPGIWVGLP